MSDHNYARNHCENIRHRVLGDTNHPQLQRALDGPWEADATAAESFRQCTPPEGVCLTRRWSLNTKTFTQAVMMLASDECE